MKENLPITKLRLTETKYLSINWGLKEKGGQRKLNLTSLEDHFRKTMRLEVAQRLRLPQPRALPFLTPLSLSAVPGLTSSIRKAFIHAQNSFAKNITPTTTTTCFGFLLLVGFFGFVFVFLITSSLKTLERADLWKQTQIFDIFQWWLHSGMYYRGRLFWHPDFLRMTTDGWLHKQTGGIALSESLLP